MLVDLPAYATKPPTDTFLRAIASFDAGGADSTTRLARGVYQSHLNWNHELGELIDDPYRESPGIQKVRDRYQEIGSTDDPVLRRERVRLLTQLSDEYAGRMIYGVCDNYTQIMDARPELDSDPIKRIIHVTPIIRSQQESEGGWRWHKWGEYIGTHEPQCEYLYDEVGIDQVYVYHVYRIKTY